MVREGLLSGASTILWRRDYLSEAGGFRSHCGLRPKETFRRERNSERQRLACDNVINSLSGVMNMGVRY